MATSVPTSPLTDSPTTFALLEKAKVQLMRCARRRPFLDDIASIEQPSLEAQGWKGPAPPSLLTSSRQVQQKPSQGPEKPTDEVQALEIESPLEIDSPSSSCEPCPEPSPVSTSSGSPSEGVGRQWSTPSEDEEEEEVAVRQAPRRPCFRKPTREVRLRQLREEVRQFCELSFDEVDPFQQQGLTCRMLAFLKSTGRVLSWQDGNQSGETAVYELLGLKEADLRVFEAICAKADDLIERHRFRQAYELLCRVRPALQGNPTAPLSEEMAKVQEAPQPPPAPRLAPAPPQSGPRPATPGPLPIPQSSTKQRLQAPVAPVEAASRNSSQSPAAAAGASQGKAASNGQAKGRRGQGNNDKSGANAGGGKYLCRVKVGIEEDHAFQVCRRIIGPGGENMKRIIEATGSDGSVKIRLRGRGSKYLEGPEHKESGDELMLCVSATNRRSFEKAATGVELLIRSVQQDYLAFCQARGFASPQLPAVRREAQRSR